MHETIFNIAKCKNLKSTQKIVEAKVPDVDFTEVYKVDKKNTITTPQDDL